MTDGNNSREKKIQRLDHQLPPEKKATEGGSLPIINALGQPLWPIGKNDLRERSQ